MRSHACGELTAEHADAAVPSAAGSRAAGTTAASRSSTSATARASCRSCSIPEDAAEAHAAAQRSAPRTSSASPAPSAPPGGDDQPAAPHRRGRGGRRPPGAPVRGRDAPFPIEDRIEAGEELRLRYRYLDLRRHEMTEALRIRHRINAITRDHMESLGLEVETPMLTRSTPEGARDFLVPSRLWPGTFYALPQSPQQLKQLLMVAGQDRYYRIVRCLRDEAPRADRSFEFTQLDVERCRRPGGRVRGDRAPVRAVRPRAPWVEVPTPFPRIPYDEMLARFGTDKPDLRYGMELADLAGVFAGTGFNAFAVRAGHRGRRDQGLAAPGGGAVSQGARPARPGREGSRRGRLVWLVVEADGVRSPWRSTCRPTRSTACSERPARATWRPASWPTGRPGARRPRRRAPAPRRSTRPDPRQRVALRWYTDPPCSTGARTRASGSPTTIRSRRRRATTWTRRPPRRRPTTSS